MPNFAEVVAGGRGVSHTFRGYKLWESPASFGEGPQSPKEMNPAWKYQTTAAVALLGCAVFANIVALVHARTWELGEGSMTYVHAVSMHLFGFILALLCLAIEVEWVQMLSIVSFFRGLSARAGLYAILAAVTYEARKEFLYFEYTEYVCAGLLTNGGVYLFFGVYFAIRSYFLPASFDESL